MASHTNVSGAFNSPGGSTPAPPTAAPATTPAVTPAWLSAFNMQWAAARGNLQRMAADVQVASKTWKAPDFSKGLGVKLDVDVLNPAISSVRQQYQALPEPLREVLPFAGVSVLTSLAVGRLYSEQLQQAHLRYGHLRDDHAQLQAHVSQLEGHMSEAAMKRSGALYEIQMAEAVAQAATAAAAAATAAATAAAAAAASASASASLSLPPAAARDSRT